MTDEKDYGKMRVTYEIVRTWNNFSSDEAQAKAIAESYLAPHGWKITSIEVGISQKDEKLIAILSAISRVLRRDTNDSTETVHIIDKMIEQLNQMMTIVR